MENGTLLITNIPPPPTWRLISISSMAAAIQFAWSLQISTLTPYVQTLCASQIFSSLLWLYTAFSSIIIQPILSYQSDHCTSRFGRRRPFIVFSTTLACVSSILIAFAKDIGYHIGDSPTKITKPRAIFIFVLGFWLLDIAINTLQNPSRALLADICLHHSSSIQSAMNWFSLFMAVGNILGYTIGSNARIHLLFPFTQTSVCDHNCANIKSCFILVILLFTIVTLIVIFSIREIRINKEVTMEYKTRILVKYFVNKMFSDIYNMKTPIKLILIVTFLNWLAWFPFILFNTDWMGREVFGGDAHGDGVVKSRYELGVRSGALGLAVNSVVVAVVALAVGPAAGFVGGFKNLWGLANLVLVVGLICMVAITKAAGEWWRSRDVGGGDGGHWLFPPAGVLGSVWLLYFVLGIPLAVSSNF